MATRLLSSSIPNLVNGVSQQPSALRLASQSIKEINRLPSVVDGNKRRPPTEHVAKLGTANISSAYIHPINRDTSERYIAVIGTGGSLTVNDIDGTSRVVNIVSGGSYITTSNPVEDLRCISIADYTFIVNKGVTVAMDSALSANSDGEGLVTVKKANYSVTYKVFVDDVEQATYTTGSSGTLSTTAVAADLAADLTSNIGADYTITTSGPTIHIEKNDGTDFGLRATDTKGGDHIKRIKGTVNNFEDLPATAPHNFIVKVTGDDEAEEDDYYVKFVGDNDGVIGSLFFDEGQWEETVAPGIEYQLDASTMPHALIRQSNGEFNLEELEWNERTAGDAVSNPNPSFVGLTLSDVFLFKNRLGFLADDKVIMSEPAEFFRFFRETVTTVLDTDPIDVAASSTQVSLLRYAVPYDKSLLLFSDQTQFRLEGGDTLTSKTVSIVPTTQYEASNKVAPVPMGTSVFFVADRGGFSTMREYFVDTQTTGDDATEVTAHVPKYIPTGIKSLTGSANNNIVVCCSGNSSSLFVYRYYYAGRDKLQSAWVRWDLGDDATVNSVAFIESNLYIIASYSDGYYLMSLPVQDGHADEELGEDPDDTQRMVYHIDRRVTEAECTSVTYDSTSDRTTIVLPYETDASESYSVVTYTYSGRVPGVLAQGLTRDSATNLSVNGDWSSLKFYVGQAYESVYKYSPIYIREQRQQGGELVVQEGRLMLNHLTISHSSTGNYTVEVDSNHAGISWYEFTGRITSGPLNIIDSISLETGEARIPVMAEAATTDITVTTSTYLPATLVSTEYEARLHMRSRR